MNAVRRGAAVVQRYVVTIFFIGVIVQFFLVGYGLFGMKHGATIDDAKSLDAHRGLGFILSDFGSILILLTTLIAWQSPLRRKVVPYVVLAVLAFVQSILATVGWHHKYVGMFHPVNALILAGLSGSLAFRSWREVRAGESTQESVAPSPT
jgi:magnesium-transporting ATPase (P-type)